MRDRLLPAVGAAVRKIEGLDTFYYGNFLRDEGGNGTGWITYTHHPRFGGNYRGLTNRLDLLLETYAYIPLDQRVLVTYAFLREALGFVASNGSEIVALLETCEEPPDEIAVRYRLEAFPGLEVEVLTREPYTLQGDPITVMVPYIGRFVSELSVSRPLAYAVPENVAAHLARHGLQIDTPEQGLVVDVEIATVRGLISTAGREILEANASPYLDADYRREKRALPPGYRLVPTAQARGAIAVYLCEAGSDDGLVACGLFDDARPGVEFPAWRVHGMEPAPQQ